MGSCASPGRARRAAKSGGDALEALGTSVQLSSSVPPPSQDLDETE